MPDVMLKKHFRVLQKLCEGNSSREMTVSINYETKNVKPFSLDELAEAMDTSFDEVGNIAANLIGMKYVQTVHQKPTFFEKMKGKEEDILWFPSDLGESFINSNNIDDIPENEPLNDKADASPSDYREAWTVLGYVYEDDNDIYDDDERKIKWAESLFDSDVLEEIKTSCEEMNKMVSEFKTKFGHDLPAANEEEIEFRDPIVTASTIRKFRALDEQLKRVNLPESEKPPAWNTRYKGGDVNLPSPSWEK